MSDSERSEQNVSKRAGDQVQLAEALRRREADRRRALEELAERIEKLESGGEDGNGNGSDRGEAELAATIERIEEARRAAAKASAERIAEIEERIEKLRESDEERLAELISSHVAEAIERSGEGSREDLGARIDELEEKLASLPEGGGEVADAVARAESRLAEVEERTVGRVSEVGEAIHSLRSRLVKLEEGIGDGADPERIDEIADQLERLDSARRSASGRIEKRVAEISEQLSASDELGGQVEANERTVRELDERVAGLERRVADRIQKLERTFEELRTALLAD